MSNTLTLSRFGLFISRGFAHGESGLSGDKLIRSFRAQAELLARKLYGFQEIADNRVELVSFSKPPPRGRNDQNINQGDTLIAKLPRADEVVSIGETSWTVSRRVTMTSCALQSAGARGKLWLSICGTPRGKQGRHPDASAVALLDWINRNEIHELAELRTGFMDSLQEIPNGIADGLKIDERSIRVNFTDDDTRPIGYLADAIYYDHLSARDLRTSQNQELRQGLEIFDHFASHAATDKITSKKFAVLRSPYGQQAVVSRLEGSSRYASLLSGMARNAGDGGGYQEELDKLDEEPLRFDQVRSRSAALHISAGLAAAEALRLDRPSRASSTLSP